MERRGHVSAFHTGKRVPVERQAAGIDVGAAQTRTGREHEDRRSAAPTNSLRLGHATHVPVVPDHERHSKSRPLRQGTGVRGVNVEPRKTLRQVRRLVEDAVPLKRPRNREPHAADAVPREIVLGKVLGDPAHPTPNHCHRSVG